MASAAQPSTPILRVKRRRSQSPAGALLLHLSAKKRKENDDEANLESPSNAIFKFAATVENTNHDEIQKVLEKTGDRLKTNPKLLKRILAKPKLDKKSDSEKRYKVISDFRGIANDDDVKEEQDRLYKLVDLVKHEEITPVVDINVEQVEQITCNGVPLVKLAEEEYVYDVYTMTSDAFSSTESEHSCIGDDFFKAMDIVDVCFLDCRDYDEDELEWRNTMNGEDSDSNDEDHWKNDYPDEECSEDDDDAHYRDEDLDMDFDKFHLRHGNAEIASSPEESDAEDELVFSRDAKFEQDCDLHGTAYAKWKRKMVKEMSEKEEGTGNDYENDDINEWDEF